MGGSMTTARSPLVRLSTGKIAELPGGDSILGAPGGAAATVAVGTTTTGAPGSSASVTNVGSSSAAVLDFTIPQGATGASGTNGTNGTNGANALIYETNFGDGVSTSYTITHNLGTLDVLAAFRVVATGAVQNYAWVAATINTITVTVSPAPASNSQRAVVMTVNGASANSLVKLGQVVTSGSQATITFSSIPATSTDLRLVLSGRDTDSAVGDTNVFLQVNGDATAGDYSAVQQQLSVGGTALNGSGPTPTASGVGIGFIPGTSGNANAIGCVDILIPNYRGTAFYKLIQALSSESYGSGSGAIAKRSALWKSTAAVSSLKITAGGAAFVDGTTATLYGLG